MIFPLTYHSSTVGLSYTMLLIRNIHVVSQWKHWSRVLVPFYNRQVAFVVPIYYFCWVIGISLWGNNLPLVSCVKHLSHVQWVNPTCNLSLLQKLGYLQCTLSMAYPFVVGRRLSLYLFAYHIPDSSRVILGGLTLKVLSAKRNNLL